MIIDGNKYVEKAKKLAKEAKEKRIEERKQSMAETDRYTASIEKKTREVMKMLMPFDGLETARGHVYIKCDNLKLGWIDFVFCDWNVDIKDGNEKYLLKVDPDAIFLSGHVPVYDPSTKFTSYNKLMDKISELIAKYL